MYVLRVKPWKSASWVPPEGIVRDMHPHGDEGEKRGEEQAEQAEPMEIRE